MVSTFFIAACLLLCVTVVKLTVISLAHKLYFDTDPESEVTEAAKAFVTLLLIVLVPYLATLIRSAWTVFGRKDLPWPRLSAIIWVGTYSNTNTVDGFIFVGTNFRGFNKSDTFVGFEIRGHSIYAPFEKGGHIALHLSVGMSVGRYVGRYVGRSVCR